MLIEKAPRIVEFFCLLMFNVDMKPRNYLLVAIGSLLTAAPAIGFAQHGHGGHHGGHFGLGHLSLGLGLRSRAGYGYGGAGVSQNPLVNQVFHTERDANAFREYYEIYYRDQGHSSRPTPGLGHKHHAGYDEDVTLKDEIQNMDESLEKLRGDAGRRGYVTSWGTELMGDVTEHATAVDRMIRGAGTSEPFWRALANRWQALREEINILADIYRVQPVLEGAPLTGSNRK